MVLSQGLLGRAPWSLDLRLAAQVGGMAGSYWGFAIASTLLWRDRGAQYPYRSVWIACLSLAVYYLALLLTVPNGDRQVLIGGTVLYITLWVLPLVLGPRIAFRGAFGLLVLALGLTAVAAVKAPEDLRTAGVRESVVHTVFHPVRVAQHRDLLPYQRRWGGIRGGLAAYGPDFLAVSGDGDFYLLRWAGATVSVERLRLPPPPLIGANSCAMPISLALPSKGSGSTSRVSLSKRAGTARGSSYLIITITGTPTSNV
jgi:hypothetical protein